MRSIDFVGATDRSLVRLIDRWCDRSIVGAIDRSDRSIVGGIDGSLVPSSGHMAWPASYDIIFPVAVWPGQLCTILFSCSYMAWPAYYNIFIVWPHGLASLLQHFHRVATWPIQLPTIVFSGGNMAWPAYYNVFTVWPHGLASLLRFFLVWLYSLASLL